MSTPKRDKEWHQAREEQADEIVHSIGWLCAFALGRGAKVQGRAFDDSVPAPRWNSANEREQAEAVRQQAEIDGGLRRPSDSASRTRPKF